MLNFYVQDDYNCRWKIGDNGNSLNCLPISEAIYIQSWSVSVPSSLSAHGSTGLLSEAVNFIGSGNKIYKPMSIAGWDLDAQSGIVIPSLFIVPYTSSSTIRYKLHNAIDSTRNINSLTIYMYCALMSVNGGIYHET